MTTIEITLTITSILIALLIAIFATQLSKLGDYIVETRRIWVKKLLLGIMFFLSLLSGGLLFYTIFYMPLNKVAVAIIATNICSLFFIIILKIINRHLDITSRHLSITEEQNETAEMQADATLKHLDITDKLLETTNQLAIKVNLLQNEIDRLKKENISASSAQIPNE